MNSESYMAQMWQQAETWQIAAAVLGGLLVGIIYFQSLRWSLNHLSETKHKIRFFASVAVFRILLFFGVMLLIAQRNPVVVLLYVLAFFITKMLIVIREKGQIVKFETEKKQ